MPCLGIAKTPFAFIEKLQKVHPPHLLKSSENSNLPPLHLFQPPVYEALKNINLIARNRPKCFQDSMVIQTRF